LYSNEPKRKPFVFLFSFTLRNAQCTIPLTVFVSVTFQQSSLACPPQPFVPAWLQNFTVICRGVYFHIASNSLAIHCPPLNVIRVSVSHGKAVSYFILLMAGFLKRPAGFEPKSGHVGFVMQKIVQGRTSSVCCGRWLRAAPSPCAVEGGAGPHFLRVLRKVAQSHTSSVCCGRWLRAAPPPCAVEGGAGPHFLRVLRKVAQSRTSSVCCGRWRRAALPPCAVEGGAGPHFLRVLWKVAQGRTFSVCCGRWSRAALPPCAAEGGAGSHLLRVLWKVA
jgi:hypothetical protein